MWFDYSCIRHYELAASGGTLWFEVYTGHIFTIWNGHFLVYNDAVKNRVEYFFIL